MPKLTNELINEILSDIQGVCAECGFDTEFYFILGKLRTISCPSCLEEATDKGIDQGIEDNYQETYDEGFMEGKEEGKESGYESGWDDGYTKCEQEMEDCDCNTEKSEQKMEDCNIKNNEKRSYNLGYEEGYADGQKSTF